ncbi:unnamed protein product [Thelazia callipaeda]|uniref:Uncharacterized protein n=1 Tax=Thelazia callipaeda TaxID=103827 RepID=A0A0N5D1X3_THECL|nr:unnamed protein product [Thelazia callipaeda]
MQAKKQKIKLDKYTVESSEIEPNALELKPMESESELPEFRIRSKDIHSMEFVQQAWLKDISKAKQCTKSMKIFVIKHNVLKENQNAKITMNLNPTI